MLKILIRTLGFTFYQQHGGLFLVVFYLLFGAVEGSQLISYHAALLIAICSSPLILALLIVIWLLYALKCLFFIRQKLEAEDYNFVKTISVLPRQMQLFTWFKVYAFLLLPILIYAVFILMMAIKNRYYISFFATVVGLGGILALLAYITYRITNFSFTVSKTWIAIHLVKFNKPFWTWPIFYLITQQRIMLLACKVTSILFLKAMLLVFVDIGPDTRVYLTALLAVVLSHAVLIFNLVKFDALYVAFMSSLPISSLKRLFFWSITFMLLLLPELLLLVWLKTMDLMQLMSCVLFCAGVMLTLQALVYGLKANMDSYLRYLLGLFFVTMLAILANYYVLYSLLLMSVSVGVYLWKGNRIDLKEIA